MSGLGTCWRAEKLRLDVRQQELEQEWEAGRTRLTQMEDHLRMGRQSLQELREKRGHAEVERAKNESDRQHLRETCVSEVNAQPEDLIASEAVFMSGEELAAAEASYREMKQRIDSMGAVNMMALEEFNECEQRFTFLEREDMRTHAPKIKEAVTPRLDEQEGGNQKPHKHQRQRGRGFAAKRE